MKINGLDIELLKHDTAKIKSKDKIIYIDPFKLESDAEKADLIICTHEHFDHCSPEDIEKIRKKDTETLGSAGAIKKLGYGKALKVGDTITVKGIKITAVEAYNTNKPYHPKGLGIGVIIEIDGLKIYHAGDTDFIPEMKQLEGKIDIAFLPVSGIYVMTAEEAARAAEIIKPRIAIPMHYNAGVAGSKEDAEEFKRRCKTKVELL